jgi:hypothetical protein
MFANEVAAIDDILLRETNQHVLERNELRRVLGFDFLQVIPEACLGGAPVGDGVPVQLVVALDLRFVPVHVDRRIAFEIERFVVALAEPRIEDELGRPT